MKTREMALIGLGVILGCFAMIMSIMFIFTGTYIKTVGCQGIDKFYTNTSFRNDTDMVRDWRNYMDHGDLAKIPFDFYYNGGDCDSVSNAIMCLSLLYGEQCDYYTWFRHDATQEDIITGHMGVKCNLTGYWEVMY